MRYLTQSVVIIALCVSCIHTSREIEVNDENEDRLIWALIQDDVRTVRKFINSGWRTNEYWREGIPSTAMFGSEKALLYLLNEKIADVNELYDGYTLFDYAVMSWYEKEPWVKNLVPSHGYVYPEDLIDAVYMVSLLAVARQMNGQIMGTLRASPHLNNNAAWYVEFNFEDPNPNQIAMARSMYGINIAPLSSYKNGEPWDVVVSVDFRSYNFINNEAYVICRGYEKDSWKIMFRFRKINGLWVIAMHNGSNCYYNNGGSLR